MSVEVRIHESFRHLAGAMETVNVQGKTVGECLKDLIEQHPGLKKWLFDKADQLQKYVEIYVNLDSAYPDELARSVKDGDAISITLTIAGG